MVSSRRRASPDSEMRSRLIAAAADIMCEQGHGAVSYRSVAERLCLKRQIVHYYFESIDELLVMLVESSHKAALADFRKAAQDDDPLRAIWRMSSDPKTALLSLELAALAARRPAVRAVVKESAEELRRLQTEILVSHLKSKGLTPVIDPEYATFLIACISQALVQEELIGVHAGHDKFRAIVDQALGEFSTTGRSSYFDQE